MRRPGARAPGRAAVGRRPPAGQPVPGARLLAPRRASLAGPPAGSALGAARPRCSASFEYAPAAPRLHGAARARRRRCAAPGGLELMPHQAQFVAAAAAGHRTFLLADEPGLGKTAQALLAAQAADAYPAARGRAERRQDQLGARGRAVDAQAAPRRSSTATARHRRLRRHRDRQLRGARPARRLARRPRLPRHGRRRGALHQEQGLAALAARARAVRADPGPQRQRRC